MNIGLFTKAVIAVNCAVPAVLLLWDAWQSRLGANPVNFAIRTTGLLSIISLVLTLTVTPLARLTAWSWLGHARRVLGLSAFFYAAIHLAIFFYWDRMANIRDTISEITMRPYLVVGIVGVLCMLPLAITSTNRMIRRLGPNRWKLLHRLCYVAAIAGALHFYMLVKADTSRPINVAALFGLLFAYRLQAHYFQLRRDSWNYRIGTQTPATTIAKTWSGQLRVAKIFQETPHVRTFRLVSLDGSKIPFEYQPGQYLNLTLMIDGNPVRRSYTIASPPSRNSYVEITVKREESGLASRHLHDTVKEGDLLMVKAPAGRFTFTGQEAPSIVMIAGGVGITPLMSKIRTLTDQCWAGSIQLIFSAKTEDELIFRSELNDLQKRFPNLHVVLTLTRESSPGWAGERGRISAELLDRVLAKDATSHIHLCGPTEMIDPLIELLKNRGIGANRIHSESFASPSRTGGGSAPITTFDATESVGATLEFSQSGTRLTELAGRTVLELAESQGIAIPYDCRSGICGQCKTRLLAGRVHMEAEDALDPRDRANGIILACQAKCLDDVCCGSVNAYGYRKDLIGS